MPLLNDWINGKFREIAVELPNIVYTAPQSFACGHRMGYKQCLLDLEHFFEAQEDLPTEFKDVYFSNAWELYE